ncbi:MAG: fumarate hydratase C-terminal domain-containing protein [Phycisphaerales bacterium]|jgi:fumarate hydratase subunit beta
MSETRKMQALLSEADVCSLKAGDDVLVSGAVYAARDMARKRLYNSIDASRELPSELAEAIIHIVGPTSAPPDRVIGAAGPTTWSGMGSFSPRLIANRLDDRKGLRGGQVREALKEYSAADLSTIGRAGALLSQYIVAAEIVACEDLGTEAVRKLQVADFPAVVVYDCYGNSVYRTGRVTK